MATPVRIPDQLSTLLRMIRMQQGLTQSDIARQLGVTVQSVSRLEQHAGRASFDRIHRLCLLLGIEIVLQKRGVTPPSGSSPSPEW